MNPVATPAPTLRLIRNLLRGVLLAWAAFWVWFVIAASFGSELPPPVWITLAWLCALAALVCLCWKRPALGGLALALAAAWAAWFFSNPGARALLAAPAFVMGLGFVVLSRGHRASARASLALLLALTLGQGCIAPQASADHPFRTSSILRHDDGSLRRAWLLEETEFNGIICQRWIWWHANGAIDNLELARDCAVQNHAFPAETRLFFDEQGRLAHAWLSRETEVDGHLCRGKWKIDTAFHPNGRVKAFFPPEDLELDGVWCEASVFDPVYLHENGKLQACKLARDAVVDGRKFEAGRKIALDAAGRPIVRE